MKDHDRGGQKWYDTDTRSLKRLQEVTAKYHKRQDRLIGRATEVSWGSLDKRLEDMTTEVKVTSAKAEDCALA